MTRFNQFRPRNTTIGTEWLPVLETGKTYSKLKVDCFHHMLKVYIDTKS